MSYNTVLFNVEGRVGTLTFNRPEKLNALNREMLAEVAQVLDHVAREPEIRVLILTGQGRAFIAGADIQAMRDIGPLTAREFSQRGQEIMLKLDRLPIPVIAAVNGFALGGGCEMAMAADLIYAADTARFGLPEINLGIIPGFGGTQRLPRLVGLSAALELCLTGRIMDVAEARALGLVARVFPAADLMAECLKVAHSLTEKSRTALQAAKQVIYRGYDLDLPSGLALEAGAFGLCFASPDAREGMSAFLEKRKPRFS
jgi:enoyl-CoA hydratase